MFARSPHYAGFPVCPIQPSADLFAGLSAAPVGPTPARALARHGVPDVVPEATVDADGDVLVTLALDAADGGRRVRPDGHRVARWRHFIRGQLDAVLVRRRRPAR